jgi:hypothetical protein
MLTVLALRAYLTPGSPAMEMPIELPIITNEYSTASD